MKNQTKLKPCPFCGGEARIYTFVLHDCRMLSQVVCNGLMCIVKPETKTYKTEKEAIEAWNRRAGDTD